MSTGFGRCIQRCGDFFWGDGDISVVSDGDRVSYQKNLDDAETYVASLEESKNLKLCFLNGTILIRPEITKVSNFVKLLEEKIEELRISVRYATALDTLDTSVGILFKAPAFHDRIDDQDQPEGFLETHHFSELNPNPGIQEVKEALIGFEEELIGIQNEHPNFEKTLHGRNLPFYLQKSMIIRLLLKSTVNGLEFHEPTELQNQDDLNQKVHRPTKRPHSSSKNKSAPNSTSKTKNR